MSSNGNAAQAGRTMTATPLPPWQDPARPVTERVDDLVGRLTLEEKIAQLYSVWPGSAASAEDMAPHQHDFADDTPEWTRLIRSGLGQITRPFGTAPVDPALGARALARLQTEIVAASRFGIPAIAHEECLTGFMTWGATVYPTPLAWGATFDPALVERMAAQIGAALRQVGVHQGLAPVLDVTRDHRWGRTEETIGEDPYLVATIGTAYVRGLESSGVIATLKHFVGYSASRAGRNFGPAAIGGRELADVLLLPFEMAIREGGARSVMSAYTEIDGVPTAADADLLTRVLRGELGFTGTVVSDYFGISFLQTLHDVAGSLGEAAELALTAGVDVELPAVRSFGSPLLDGVRDGTVAEQLVDRAVTRVLRQKCELGMLDSGWRPLPDAPAAPAAAGMIADPAGRPPVDEASVSHAGPAGMPNAASAGDRANGGSGDIAGTLDLDPPAARALARELAEESVTLLANDGALPLAAGSRIALVGPLADDAAGMLGCYAFPSHVGRQHPQAPAGVAIPTLLAALRAELPTATITHSPGCVIADADGHAGNDTADAGNGARPSIIESGGLIAEAMAAAERAEVCVAVLGDRAGLFGKGTSGEGTDAADLRLPGAQADLLEALLDTGTPVVLVLLAGRPYALGPWADRLAAIVQAFFPGEEGGPAVAGILSGRVCPSGRLPVSVPREHGGQPATYLAPPLGHRTEVSNIDPTALYPFGHGLSYTVFSWTDVLVDGRAPDADEVVEIPTDGAVTVSLTVRNQGERAGADVVQLYLHDPVAQVTRPVIRLTGYARVALAPGEARRVDFRVHTDLSSFTGRDGHRVVEPGDLEVRLSASSADHRHRVRLRLVGEKRPVGHLRQLTATVTVR